jgi:hypothetical protein
MSGRPTPFEDELRHHLASVTQVPRGMSRWREGTAVQRHSRPWITWGGPALVAAVAATVVVSTGSTLLHRRPTSPALATTPGPARAGAGVVAWGLTDANLETVETAMGHRAALVRTHGSWGAPVVNDRVRQLTSAGRGIVHSLGTSDAGGNPVYWADVAGGKWDRQLATALDEMDALTVPAFFVMSVEPDDVGLPGCRAPGGTDACGAEFVAAWRHAHDIGAARGLHHVQWVWTVSAYSFGVSRADAFYPGDAYVDWIGVDPFNLYDCRGVKGPTGGPWRSFKDSTAAPQAWLSTHAAGKPVMAVEWGSVPGAPGQRAQWITEAAQTIQTPEYSRWHAMLWRNGSQAAPRTGCGYRIDDDPSSLEAFAAVGRSGHFGGTG